MALHHVGISGSQWLRRHCQKTPDEVPLRQMKVIVTLLWHICISHTSKVQTVQLPGSPLSSAMQLLYTEESFACCRCLTVSRV